VQLEIFEVWKAWQNFPELFKTYWGSYSPPENGGDPEWSNGVIFPFIVTSFVPILNCKVRMGGRSLRRLTRKRWGLHNAH
jgi:hypothetical protein